MIHIPGMMSSDGPRHHYPCLLGVLTILDIPELVTERDIMGNFCSNGSKTCVIDN